MAWGGGYVSLKYKEMLIIARPLVLPVLYTASRSKENARTENIFTHSFSFALYTLHNTHACAILVAVTTRCNRVPLPLSFSPSLSRCIRGMRGISINSSNQKRRGGRGWALCSPPPHPTLPPSFYCMDRRPLPHASTDVAFLPPRCSRSWDL